MSNIQKEKKLKKKMRTLETSISEINDITEYPNDTTGFEPLLKNIKNISYNHIGNLMTPSSVYCSISNPKHVSLRTPSDVNRLTINNNTNISNLNLFVLCKTAEKKPVKENKIRRKEPEDNTDMKKNLKKKVNFKTHKAIIKNKRTFNIKNIKKIEFNNTLIKEKKTYLTPMNTIKKKISFKNNENNHTLAKNLYGGLLATNKIEPKGKIDLFEFTKIKQIGKGTFGKIFSVKWKYNNKKYALKKELLCDFDLVEKRNNNIKIIHEFCDKTNYKGLIKIYGNLWEKNKKDYNYYELMEIGETDWEKEIFERTKKQLYYTEEELFNIISQLIHTLSLLQKNHITHRDIKPQNILVINGQYKLCDFGELRKMKREEGIVVQRIRGSELYMSPILFFGLKNDLIQVKHNTYKSDVYSLGMCLFYAACMHFSGTDEIREIADMKQINEILYKYLGDRYSSKMISLMYMMLETEELLRPDFILLEKYLNNNDF